MEMKQVLENLKIMHDFFEPFKIISTKFQKFQTEKTDSNRENTQQPQQVSYIS